jgi:hypothetical protein
MVPRQQSCFQVVNQFAYVHRILSAFVVVANVIAYTLDPLELSLIILFCRDQPIDMLLKG